MLVHRARRLDACIVHGTPMTALLAEKGLDTQRRLRTERLSLHSEDRPELEG